MPVAETHIYGWAPPGERQHERTTECWCRPDVGAYVIAGLVVTHSGQISPSVKASLDREANYAGTLCPPYRPEGSLIIAGQLRARRGAL